MFALSCSAIAKHRFIQITCSFRIPHLLMPYYQLEVYAILKQNEQIFCMQHKYRPPLVMLVFKQSKWTDIVSHLNALSVIILLNK